VPADGTPGNRIVMYRDSGGEMLAGNDDHQHKSQPIEVRPGQTTAVDFTRA
jgi:hypothetical protein